MLKLWIFLIIIVLTLIANCVGSQGDKSKVHNRCLIKCYSDNCNNDMEFKKPPSAGVQLLWSCKDDCKYICMWSTVEYFTKQGFQVPQFYGKWPFVRIMGMQEPASVVFSLLNLYIHLRMYKRFRKEIKSSTPMSFVWSYFSLVCLNGWLWSTIFHARDKPFTEAMDYSCAFVMVLTSLYCILLRATYRSNKAFVILTCGYISVLYIHLSHLWSGEINYGYNMKFNIILGFLSFAITMIWWYYNRKHLTHAFLIGWFNILTVSVILLEVADFPPVLWIFDAHSLWHAATAPIAILLYRFIIQDCSYLRRQHDKVLLGID